MPSALAGGLLLLVCARLSGALELSARGVAHSVLVRCATDGAFADRSLSSTLSKAALEPRDARLATEITYGVLRNTRSLDFALEQLVAQLDRTSAAERAALRMGTFELLHMRTPDHAAVSQAVATASSKRSRGFLNGVLRNMARKRGSLTRPDDAGAGLVVVVVVKVRVRIRVSLTLTLTLTLTLALALALTLTRLRAERRAGAGRALLDARLAAARAERHRAARARGAVRVGGGQPARTAPRAAGQPAAGLGRGGGGRPRCGALGSASGGGARDAAPNPHPRVHPGT